MSQCWQGQVNDRGIDLVPAVHSYAHADSRPPPHHQTSPKLFYPAEGHKRWFQTGQANHPQCVPEAFVMCCHVHCHTHMQYPAYVG